MMIKAPIKIPEEGYIDHILYSLGLCSNEVNPHEIERFTEAAF
jgi:hypothetical protein